MNANLAFQPKIKSAEDGKKFITDFAQNPPTSPIEAIKNFADATGVSGTVTAAISTAFPLAGSVLPMLSGIFSLFAGGAPSIGEVTLSAIKNLGEQINAVAKRLENILTAEIQSSAQRTIDLVLEGQNEIARQQSAASVFINTIEAQILDNVELEKNVIYAEFLAATNEAQAQAMNELKKMLADYQTSINKFYDLQLAEILNTIYSMVEPLLNALNDYLSDQNQSSVQASRETSFPTIQPKPPGKIAAESNNMNFVMLCLAAAGFMLISMKRKKN